MPLFWYEWIPYLHTFILIYYMLILVECIENGIFEKLQVLPGCALIRCAEILQHAEVRGSSADGTLSVCRIRAWS